MTTTETKSIQPITRTRIAHAEHKYGKRHALVPVGVTLEDALQNEYWSGVAELFRAGDEIRLNAEDESFVAWVYVRVATKQYLVLETIQSIDLAAAKSDADPVNEPYVKYNGPSHKWAVFVNDQAVDYGYDTRHAAEDALKEHMKKAA